MDNYEVIIGIILNLSVIIGFTVSIVNWINNRLNSIHHKLSDLNNRLSIADERFEGKLLTYELLINGNKELIEHRTTRFTEEMRRAKGDVREDMETLQKQIDQISGFLDKTTEFRPRI